MTLFKVEYQHPERDEWITEEKEFSSKLWAEDYAYTLADKGPYKITPIDDEAVRLLREARPYLSRTNWGQPGTDLPERIDAYLAQRS